MKHGRREIDQQKQFQDDHDLLVRIDTKLEGLLGLVAGKADALAVAAIAADVVDHEKRVRDLEQFNWKQAGMQAGVSGLLMLLISLGLRFWR